MKQAATQELKSERLGDYLGNLKRRKAAQERYEAGKYGYTEPQEELDGVSLASLEDEIGQQEFELVRDGVVTRAELDELN